MDGLWSFWCVAWKEEGGESKTESKSVFVKSSTRARVLLSAWTTGSNVSGQSDRYPDTKQALRMVEFARSEGREHLAKAAAGGRLQDHMFQVGVMQRWVHMMLGTKTLGYSFMRENTELKPVLNSHNQKPFRRLAQQQRTQPQDQYKKDAWKVLKTSIQPMDSSANFQVAQLSLPIMSRLHW